MEWDYHSPVCGRWVWIDWEVRNEKVYCPHRGQLYDPPGPEEDPEAYVDTHDYPEEMVQAVYWQKGKRCSVPGCTNPDDTLDHRIPYSRGGKTSVKNLVPMCRAHNASKGDRPYRAWLRETRTRR